MPRRDRTFLVVDDAAAVAAEAARRMIAQIEGGGERPAVCLTGGATPKRLYELLASPSWSGLIPWDRVHWFMSDDRFTPASHSLSNMGMARRAFLDKFAPPENIHAIVTDAPDPMTAAQRYQNELRVFYRDDVLDPARPLFCIVFLGVGRDGHTASIFPGAPALGDDGRWVESVAQANVEPFVPRVTLTLPILASCKEMLFLVSGAEKRPVLSRIVQGEDLPAARACSHGATTWLVDAAAAGV